MTREARWAVKVGKKDQVLCWSDGTARRYKSGRKLFPTRREALRDACGWPSAQNARLVKVTRRPKQPPPLAVGDEVVVRGKVCGLNDVLASVECRSGRFIAPRADDCERPGWWNGVKP